MPVDEMIGWPPKNPGIANADIDVDSDWPANPSNRSEVTTINIGMFKNGKFYPDFHAYFRWEMDIPAGAVINGIRFQSYGTGAYAGATVNLTGGWCKPQTTGVTDWQGANGVSEWVLGSDAPLAERGNGQFPTPTVFHGDAPAFSNLAAPTQSDPTGFWDVAEGTLSGLVTTTGMIDQLTSYLAANESLRGHSRADSIPSLLYFYRPWTGNIPDNFQRIKSLDHFPASARPRFYIDWSPGGPEPGEAASGRPGLGVAASGRPGLDVAASGRPGLGVAASGRPNLGAAASGRPGLGTAATGKPKLS